MRILLDHGTPAPLRKALSRHEVATVYAGFARLVRLKANKRMSDIRLFNEIGDKGLYSASFSSRQFAAGSRNSVHGTSTSANANPGLTAVADLRY